MCQIRIINHYWPERQHIFKFSLVSSRLPSFTSQTLSLVVFVRTAENLRKTFKNHIIKPHNGHDHFLASVGMTDLTRVTRSQLIWETYADLSVQIDKFVVWKFEHGKYVLDKAIRATFVEFIFDRLFSGLRFKLSLSYLKLVSQMLIQLRSYFVLQYIHY